jgi:hypothetical protein
MIRAHAGLLAALALLLTAEWGCHRKPKTPAQPSAPAAAPLQMPPPPKVEPHPIEEPPQPPPPLPAPPEQQPSVIAPNVIKLPPPPKAAKKRPARPAAAKPKPEEAKPAGEPAEPAAQPAPPSTAPVLEEVLPGDQSRRLRQSLASYQSAARHALAAIQGHRLSREQNETAARARAFLRQSEAAEGRDIAAAAELARRAALLAEDLRKSIE